MDDLTSTADNAVPRLRLAPQPAAIGDDVALIDTPALVVDLDAMDRNIARMAGEAAALGMRLRPHAKTHKCAAIARAQIEAGAVGIAVQKATEAEAMVDGGICDVLVTNQVLARGKLDRLAARARRAKIGLCVDAGEGALVASAAAEAAGASFDVMVEIDIGQGRCGVMPGIAAAELAALVDGLPGLRFSGLQAYHGGIQHLATPAERTAAVALSAAACQRALDALAAAGLSAETIGGAGTGTFREEGAAGVWNEVQPGSYVLMDADYGALDTGAAPPFEHALYLATQVISRRDGGHAVLDAGHKAASIDSGPPVPVAPPGARATSLNDEHTVLALPAGHELALGDPVWLIPGHVDPTVNLHDWLVAVRGLVLQDGQPVAGLVEAVWRVDARGGHS
ncbi:MAG: DSD1 family PLP-dependent enzyme [Pseudomonadota bacterium]